MSRPITHPSARNRDGRSIRKADALGERFARMLAWNFERGLPLERLLDDLARTQPWWMSLLIAFAGNYYTTGILAPIWRDDTLFESGILGMAHDLRRDLPLSRSLARRMSHFLPDWYISEVERAEDRGTLAQDLTRLADEFAWRRDLTYTEPILTIWTRLYLLGLATCGVMLTQRILAVFVRMISEMSDGPRVFWFQHSTRIVPGVSKYDYPITETTLYLHSYMLVIWLALIVVLILPIFLPYRRQYVARTIMYDMLEWTWLYLPIFGSAWRRRQLIHGFACLSSSLAAGESLTVAVQWNRDHCRSPWMRTCWHNYLQRLQAGHDWVDAWETLRVNQRYAWVMRNARSRQDPATAFGTLARLLADDERTVMQRRFMYREFLRIGLGLCIVMPIILGTYASLSLLISLTADL